jgi:hypothetical protein
MNADGSGQTNLIPDAPYPDRDPAWSPDGTQIVFTRMFDVSFLEFEVYVINADGGDQINLTNSPGEDGGSTWQPLGNMDTTPPAVTCTVTPSYLWPPDHTMRIVIASVTVTDFGSGPNGFILLSVVSSEPDAGLGTLDKPHDIHGFANGTADRRGRLRAERADGGPGRVYTLTYQGMDKAGNVAKCAATVTVPLFD